MAASLPKIKAEAERLDLMDMAAGIMAELLYTDKLLSQVEEYRPIMLHVSILTTSSSHYHVSINLLFH